MRKLNSKKLKNKKTGMIELSREMPLKPDLSNSFSLFISNQFSDIKITQKMVLRNSVKRLILFCKTKLERIKTTRLISLPRLSSTVSSVT